MLRTGMLHTSTHVHIQTKATFSYFILQLNYISDGFLFLALHLSDRYSH